MSNSFNISVKPEIAAVKVDTADIRADVTVIHDTDIPAIKTDTGFIRTDLASHRADDMAALGDMLTTIDTEVGLIHTSDLPDIDGKIDAIDTEVGVIDGIADAIKLKTDNIQQNVRGDYTLFYATSDSIVEVEVCNITGHGKLNYVWGRCANAADTVSIVIYLDGIPSRELIHTGDTLIQMIILSDNYNVETFFQTHFVPHDEATQYLMYLEFATSCQITVRRSAGTTDLVHCKACVSIDPF